MDVFWCPLGGLGAQFSEKIGLRTMTFPYMFFVWLPASFLEDFGAPTTTRNLKFIDIYTTVVRNQGSHTLGLRWFRDASGLDFGVILEACGIILVPLGLTFSDF